MGLIILAASTLLQFIAGTLALRLVWVTRRASWLFLASGIFLMTVRRTMTLTGALMNEQTVDASDELVALCVSTLMVIGIAFIAPYFREILRAGEKVRESEQRLQAILDNSDSVVYVKDLSGRYELVNRKFEQLFETERAEVLHKTDLELFPHEFAAVGHANDQAVVQAGVARQFDEKVPSADGSVRDYMSVKFPLRGDDGVVRAICCISTDINDRLNAERAQRELEANMLHAQKLESLGVMAGGIAHDFNNLLVPISAGVDVVENVLGEHAKPVTEDLESIRSAAFRAADLCKQLLAYSGQGHFRVEPLDLSERIRDFAPLLEMAAKGATMDYKLADDLPATKADATQLQQIVLNLVVNAAEAAMDSSSHVTITTGSVEATEEELDSSYLAGSNPEPGSYVFLEVSDNGTGMDEETVARLFEPFFTTKFAGRGLGLSAVLGIVRGHGGSISVHSKSNEGTRIRVMLPATDAPAVPSRPKVELAPSKGAGTILVVDDEKIILAITEQILEKAGFDVLVASNGREGLKVYAERSGPIDVVLLDMTMPGMSGKETLSALREQDPNVSVVLSSGYDESTANALDGVRGFLQKPYTAAALVDVLEAAMASQDAARD